MPLVCPAEAQFWPNLATLRQRPGWVFVSAVISKATKGFIIMVYYFVVIVFARINLFFHKKCIGGEAMSIGVYVTAGKDGRIGPSSVFGPVQQSNN